MEVKGHILSESNGIARCAVRINAPSSVEHTPTHYVLLIDISESMNDGRKIENVKKCVSLLLNFFKDEDHVSLITFGEQSTILLNCAQTLSSAKASIKSTVSSIHTDGCTNLSAGLLNVKTVLEGGRDAKSALFLLTDGHANRGVSNPENLTAIVQQLKEEFSSMSLAVTAYGTDHNASLLRGFAEKVQGSYNIVDSLESTAFAFGDSLGGIMSTCAQNTKIKIPEEAILQGPLAIKNGAIPIGDVFSGTKTLYLFDIPTNKIGEVKFECVTLPSLQVMNEVVQFTQLESPDVEIELTGLRYKCTAILGHLVEYWRMSAEKKAEFRRTVDEFKTEINKEVYNGHPIAELLRSEIPIIEQGLVNNPPQDNGYSQRVTQHLTTMTTGRGYTTPMAPRVRSRNVHFTGSATDTDNENPINILGGAPLTATTSAFQNPEQMRVSQLMAASSMAPDEDGAH